jgi:hypothetical protein
MATDFTNGISKLTKTAAQVQNDLGKLKDSTNQLISNTNPNSSFRYTFIEYKDGFYYYQENTSGKGTPGGAGSNVVQNVAAGVQNIAQKEAQALKNVVKAVKSAFGSPPVIKSLVNPYDAFPGQVYPPRIRKGTPNQQTASPSEGRSLSFDPDPRMVYLPASKKNPTIYSMDPTFQKEMVDGMVIDNSKGQGKKNFKMGQNPDSDTSDMKMYYGVPSIMNYNSYINLQAAGGRQGNFNIQDQENQPLWYQKDGSTPYVEDDDGKLFTTSPNVSEIIEWSQQSAFNINYKFPYRYQDFVYCKWWKKIPNNYLITLRRYATPVNDSVSFDAEADEAGKGSRKDAKKTMSPVATAITWMGEDTGNKMSSIVGPITSGLKWKPIKADVWQVTTSYTPGSSDFNPLPKTAQFLSLMTEGRIGAEDAPPVPPDPYENGPYANKVYGGVVTVIDSTMARDRGMEFKHEIKLVFEYSARSIGKINTRAAMLDIIGNMMLMGSAAATFWGGMNRFMPYQGRGVTPFLGGAAGLDAWTNGNPLGFLDAVGDQIVKAIGNLGEIFSKILADPLAGLQSLAAGSAGAAMRSTSTPTRTQIQGLHSLLTGKEIGEWHVTVGNPMNPIMMIGNLVCTGVTLEFNDEMGPDDFPTEIKATITLEHGMPRDRTRIESMFNRGRGRIYSLPKGYEQSLSSFKESAGTIDTSKEAGSGGGGRSGKGSGNPLLKFLGDPNALKKAVEIAYRTGGQAADAANGAVHSWQSSRYVQGTVQTLKQAREADTLSDAADIVTTGASNFGKESFNRIF